MNETQDGPKQLIIQCALSYFINNLAICFPGRWNSETSCFVIFPPVAFKLNFAVCHSHQHPQHYHYQQTVCAHPLGTQHGGTHLGQGAVISSPWDSTRVIVDSVHCSHVLMKGRGSWNWTLPFSMQLHPHLTVTATLLDSIFFLLDYKIMQH